MESGLHIVVRGQPVEGRFLHRSESMIEVEMLAPFEGFRTSLVMVSFSQSRSPHGFLGSEGISSGEALLRQLYRLGSILSRNLSQLRKAYREYQALASEHDREGRLSDEFFRMIKIDLDEDYKRGAIDKREYRKRLLAAREAHSRYHERSYLLVREFFEMHFPLPLTPDLMQQVLEFLRRDFLQSGTRGETG